MVNTRTALAVGGTLLFAGCFNVGCASSPRTETPVTPIVLRPPPTAEQPTAGHRLSLRAADEIGEQIATLMIDDELTEETPTRVASESER